MNLPHSKQVFRATQLKHKSLARLVKHDRFKTHVSTDKLAFNPTIAIKSHQPPFDPSDETLNNQSESMQATTRPVNTLQSVSDMLHAFADLTTGALSIVKDFVDPATSYCILDSSFVHLGVKLATIVLACLDSCEDRVAYDEETSDALEVIHDCIIPIGNIDKTDNSPELLLKYVASYLELLDEMIREVRGEIEIDNSIRSAMVGGAWINSVEFDAEYAIIERKVAKFKEELATVHEYVMTVVSEGVVSLKNGSNVQLNESTESIDTVRLTLKAAFKTLVSIDGLEYL